MGVIDNIYEKILNDTSMTNDKKVELIEGLYEEIDEINTTNYHSAISLFKYCSECKKYHLAKDFTKDIVEREVSRLTNPYNLYLEKPEYELRRVLFYASICPEGHVLIEREI